MATSPGISYFEVEKNIEIAVNDRRRISVLTWSVNTDIEQQLDKIIDSILSTHGNPELKAPVYTCIKELAINGTKANQKRIFFEQQGLNMDDPGDYTRGLDLYKQSLNEHRAVELGQIARERGLYVKISFDYDETGMCVRVRNNTPINPDEETRLRQKLARVVGYDDIVQFYMEQADETEGAGMGLALIIMLLKGAGIDPHYFRIGQTGEVTMAVLEVPFNENFVSIRERFLAGKKA
ncbi:MAG TPA: histidine kinase [Spirochaetota bacterium]|nr:histidine kinase [Spirochaetota bacterium]